MRQGAIIAAIAVGLASATGAAPTALSEVVASSAMSVWRRIRIFPPR